MNRLTRKHNRTDAKAARRVVAGILFGISTLSLVLTLVLPPLAQAAANDAQASQAQETEMGGGIPAESAESDTFDNNENAIDPDTAAAGEDTANDDAAAEDTGDKDSAPADKQTAYDGTTDNAPVALTAEDGFAETGNANDLPKLASGTSLRLTSDITYDGRIDITNATAVLDLNGHKIWHSGATNEPLFNLNGASLTIKDSNPAQDAKSNVSASVTGNLAKESWNGGSVTIDYYVTESKANAAGTGTTESLVKHTVTGGGAIVGTSDQQNMKLINVYGGGSFTLDGGMITMQSKKAESLVYATGSTLNIKGGYICGNTSMIQGGGIEVDGESTLNISGGVIAGNYAPDGGGVYANGSTVNMTGGVISGNGTFKDKSGYGAGVCALGSNVTISGGYITNNSYQYNYETQKTETTHKGSGCHGGGGIAAYDSGSLTINSGYITGNYSAEAGGGVYAGSFNKKLKFFNFNGGIIANNVAELSEGGGVRIAAPTEGVFKVNAGSKAYITNNTTNTTNDWGGGGIFVQGGGTWKETNGKESPVDSATLKIYNTQISDNSAQGYGGGFAACPSGKTAITDTEGIAIFGNKDENGRNLSGGTNNKNEDQPTTVSGGEITEAFKKAGHKDLFLIRKSSNADYIAAVTGEMLGGGAAEWSGTIDNQATTIKKNDGAQAKYMIGLASHPSKDDEASATAAATLFITGNKSSIHGGGIMTNGDVVAGSTTQVNVYPKMKLAGTKSLTGRTLVEDEFEFELLKAGADGTAPSFNKNGELQLNGCSVVDTAENDASGNFTFDLGEAYTSGNLVYYLVEKPGSDPDVTYDKTVYKIVPTVTKDNEKSHSVLDITYTYYTVSSVEITKTTADGKTSVSTVTPSTTDNVISIELTSVKTFTNAYTQYNSTGSWTPKVTKTVKGGVMKEFSFEFADNPDFTGAKTVSTTADGGTPQPLNFSDVAYELKDLIKGNDSTGRGSSKTFTYYVREKQPDNPLPGYTYDQSVYKFTVKATDESNKSIACKVTYTKIKDADGNDIPTDEQKSVDFSDSSVPTFTNTYSTTLPSSGMSGISLTYLAGAAVLCMAAAWIHARRKADTKGGEHHE